MVHCILSSPLLSGQTVPRSYRPLHLKSDCPRRLSDWTILHSHYRFHFLHKARYRKLHRSPTSPAHCMFGSAHQLQGYVSLESRYTPSASGSQSVLQLRGHLPLHQVLPDHDAYIHLLVLYSVRSAKILYCYQNQNTGNHILYRKHLLYFLQALLLFLQYKVSDCPHSRAPDFVPQVLFRFHHFLRMQQF